MVVSRHESNFVHFTRVGGYIEIGSNHPLNCAHVFHEGGSIAVGSLHRQVSYIFVMGEVLTIYSFGIFEYLTRVGGSIAAGFNHPSSAVYSSAFASFKKRTTVA